MIQSLRRYCHELSVCRVAHSAPKVGHRSHNHITTNLAAQKVVACHQG